MSRYFYALVMLAVCSLTCRADEAGNVRIVTAMIETINGRDLGALDALVSRDVVRHSAATPGVVVTSISEFPRFWKLTFLPFRILCKKLTLSLVPANTLRLGPD